MEKESQQDSLLLPSKRKEAPSRKYIKKRTQRPGLEKGIHNDEYSVEGKSTGEGGALKRRRRPLLRRAPGRAASPRNVCTGTNRFSCPFSARTRSTRCTRRAGSRTPCTSP